MTTPGRYCAPRRCYCGSCPGYAEQRALADVLYQQELAKALRETGERANAQQAQSWADRDEPTWLDA